MNWIPTGVERSIHVHMANVVLFVLFLFWQPIPLEEWNLDEGPARHALWLSFAARMGHAVPRRMVFRHSEHCVSNGSRAGPGCPTIRYAELWRTWPARNPEGITPGKVQFAVTSSWPLGDADGAL